MSIECFVLWNTFEHHPEGTENTHNTPSHQYRERKRAISNGNFHISMQTKSRISSRCGAVVWHHISSRAGGRHQLLWHGDSHHEVMRVWSASESGVFAAGS